MSQVRSLHPTPQSFDSLMSELVASLASQQGEKILSELRTHITKEFAELKGTMRGIVIEQPLDEFKMAEFLNITKRTLRRWINEGKIPPSMVHRLTDASIYMFPSQVVNHLKSL